ncbi:MAG TPA: kelch repeat-containing protein [Candidatus Binataceae bacterium]|nr:kelch repeat-containing protein [Candidatus Binataceae bacterium]
MKRLWLVLGALATALLMRRSIAWGISATTGGSTWGQILFVCDERDGGHPARDVAELYDPISNQFAALRPVMMTGRTGTTATVIVTGPNAGKILVAGGFNQKKGPLASSELYDPATNRFTGGPNLSIDLDDHTATVIGSGPRSGWILIAALRTTNLYDPLSNDFLVGPGMISERIDHTATTIPSGPNAGKILFAGGMGHSGTVTDLYDPTHDSFEPGPPMNFGRDQQTASVIPTGPDAGKILLVGGWGERLIKEDIAVPVPLASTELYDPATNRFAPPKGTATLKFARGSHTATVISLGPNTGKILIAGGQQDDEHVLSSTEIYDVAANRFDPGAVMHSARTQHAAMAIASGPNAGKILIAGGLGLQCDRHGCASVPLFSTEIYDPVANAFTRGPDMRGAPGDLVAVQLPQSPPKQGTSGF